jgi:hypothetical protein
MIQFALFPVGTPEYVGLGGCSIAVHQKEDSSDEDAHLLCHLEIFRKKHPSLLALEA